MSSEVKAFKCDWCGRCFGRLLNANAHEKACRNNPERKNCKTCVHGVMDYSQGPFCTYHEKPMWEKPFYIDCETYANYGFEDDPHKQPGTCLNYEYKGKAEWTRKDGEGV